MKVTCRDLKPVHYTPKELIKKYEATIEYLDQRRNEIDEEIVKLHVQILSCQRRNNK